MGMVLELQINYTAATAGVLDKKACTAYLNANARTTVEMIMKTVEAKVKQREKHADEITIERVVRKLSRPRGSSKPSHGFKGNQQT